MKTQRSAEGELLIDHSASPGLPADFYAKIGLPGFSVGEGRRAEAPTATCCHCNAVVVLNPLRTRPRSHCRRCNAYICDNPACHVECLPFAKVLDDQETAAYRAEQQRLMAGASAFSWRMPR